MATISNCMLINGQLRSKASGGSLELTEPATEQVWNEVPAAGEREIDEALEAATKAFRKSRWSSSNPGYRTEVLYRIAGLIREHSEQLALLESRNVGKPIGDARWEINAGARCFEYYAGGISRFGGQTIPVASNGFDYTLRVPVGVVAAIVPWNFPFLMACWKVAPALATGNAVLLKPASLTPLTALALGQLAMEAGIPEAILQVVPGRSSEIGDYLVSHSLVDKITLTGETSTGAHIVKLAADDIKRVSLELGGKSPNIIFADADVDAAAMAAPMAVFANTGQDCCARSRILVEKSAYGRFLETFVEATQTLVVGDPLDESTQVGPMVSAKQRESVEAHIDIARQEGGRILCGGNRPKEPGYYLAPTIVEGLGSSARVCQEEIFGPVACVIPFRDEQEAIELANDTKYGLSGSLWTKDLERALRVARAVRSGVMSVNTNSSVYVEAPFGGFKRSGFGRDLGMEAMQLYTEVKNVFISVQDGS
ncbi:MAG TPA: aldehyde dehydrogenase family protein [Sedimentisphaerales bacterium]|nr:aldehyde dehydrogenase family protein [Sedimentisphaerales bacterium]